MADSPVFDFVCEALERRTALDRLAVRGTVRLVLKDAGLDAKTVRKGEMEVVIESLFLAALTARGVADPASVVEGIRVGVAAAPDAAEREEAQDVLARLARPSKSNDPR